MNTTTAKEMEEYMTVKEATSKFSISRAKLYRLFDKGLKKHKFGGSTLIKIDEIAGLITQA